MAKEFSYFGVIHSDPSWESLKGALKRVIKPGQIVAYELSAEGMEELNPYLDLVRKAKSEKLSVQEKEKLDKFFLISKSNPTISFNAKLIYMLQSMNCKIVPLGSSVINSTIKKIDAKIAQAQTRNNTKQVEKLKQQRENVIAIKEHSAFRKRVIRTRPDAVIVGAKHKGAFVGLPQKVVVDQLPFARRLFGKKLDEAMHRRGLARSAMAKKRINKLIGKKSSPKVRGRKK